MKDFVLAALPLVVCSIAIVIVLNTFSKKKQSKNLKESKDVLECTSSTKKESKTEENNMSTGMSLGMCFGVAIGSIFMNKFGSIALSYGICFGMLGGILIGLCIKKN